MDSLGNIWKHTYSGSRNCSALWLLIIVRYTSTLTYLLTYIRILGFQKHTSKFTYSVYLFTIHFYTALFYFRKLSKMALR